jgi:N-acetylglucosaminyl-diphospho-decaprenol L-rhamnosyltransferase
MPSPSMTPPPADHADAFGATTSHIYVVVPVHNRRALIERFLNCMRRQTFRNFTIIVVDDGSTDGTSALIQETFSEVHLLGGDGNLWWTGATNLGVRHALTQAQENDAILIINDDIEVDSNYLESLFRASQATPKALVGSVVVDLKNPKVIYDGGRIVNWWTAKMRTLNVNKRLSEFDKDHCVDVSYLTGSGTLIPARVFRDVGLYDGTHFQQMGDPELPVRAKNRGYRLIVSYAAVVKLHVDQCAGINIASGYSLADLGEYFFGIKSACRLKYRFFLSSNTATNGYNTATNVAQLCCFLVRDLARLTIHLLRRLRLKPEIGNVT